MAKVTNHHVMYNKSTTDWVVKKDGASRASGHYDTKQQAVDAGRKISQNANTELTVHNKDGKIGWKDSHEHDPHPPKG